MPGIIFNFCQILHILGDLLHSETMEYSSDDESPVTPVSLGKPLNQVQIYTNKYINK